jgi:hypothetical protein
MLLLLLSRDKPRELSFFLVPLFDASRLETGRLRLDICSCDFVADAYALWHAHIKAWKDVLNF